MNLSQKVELIIHILDQCQKDANWYDAKLKEAEAEELNLNHELEGVATDARLPPKYRERARIATHLQNVLIQRRVAKDGIRSHQPLIKFIESEQGTKAINGLKQALGELRKVEASMAERVYAKRETENPPSNKAAEKKLNKMIREWKKQCKGRKGK